MRKAIITLVLVVLTAAPASAGLRDRRCNPLTYGRPHSCYVSPVQQIDPRFNGFGLVR